MNGTNYEVPHCGAFSTPHSHPSWAQIRLRILFANILSLHFFLNVRDHVSQPNSTTNNITVLYTSILILECFEGTREVESVWFESILR